MVRSKVEAGKKKEGEVKANSYIVATTLVVQMFVCCG